MNYLRKVGLLAIVSAITFATSGAFYATCIGADPCRACKNCKYCGYCAKRGGTCGICKRR